MQDMGIVNADKGNAVVGVECNLGIAAAIGGDRHVGDVMEAIGAHVDLVVIALAEVIDVVIAVTGREDEGIGAGYHSTGRSRG